MSAPAGAAPGPGAPVPALAVDARGLLAGHGRLPVLRDLDLQLPVGQTLALLGANGSGKSTLLALLAGLRAPAAGTLRVLGRDLPGERWALRGHVGLVAHAPLLYRDLSIEENLRYHAALHGLGRDRVEAVLEQTDLVRRRGQLVGDLSRGLTQRAAVARALLADPDLLLLDEPLANLDVGAAGLVDDLLAPRPGRTRVIAGHDPASLLPVADRVLVLGPGATVRHQGPAGEVDAASIEELLRA